MAGDALDESLREHIAGMGDDGLDGLPKIPRGDGAQSTQIACPKRLKNRVEQLQCLAARLPFGAAA